MTVFVYIWLIIARLQTETASVDADIQKEYARQREHLERSVASLRKKLVKDSEIHRADNVRIMQVRAGAVTSWCTLFVHVPVCSKFITVISRANAPCRS